MTDRRLQVFHAVAKLSSFTRAAEVLHMTQPAVTFQIRQIEDHFKTRLFNRIHNHISLTEAGTIVFDYAERIFNLYSEMERTVRGITGEINRALTIGASTTIAAYMLPGLLGNFKDKHPDVIIHLRISNTDGIVSMVENNMVDLGIVESQVSHHNLIVEPCSDDNLVVIVPPYHMLAVRKELTFADILEFPFICREEGSGTREAVNEYMGHFTGCAAGLKIVMELASPEAVKGAVEAGMGVSVVSYVTIKKELRLGTLVGIPLNPPLRRTFSFVHQRQRFRVRLLGELLELTRAYCTKHQDPIPKR